MSITLVMPSFLSTFPRISPTHSRGDFWKGLLTALLQLGAMLGAIQSGFVADQLSRKKTLFIGLVWFIVGSSIQTGSMGYGMLIVGRLVGGIGIGILSMVAPLYISEISPPNIRGALLVLEEWSIVFGIVVAFYITYGTKEIEGEWSWRLPFLLQIVPALVMAAMIGKLPYSPRWLVAQGRCEEALKVLARLRRGKVEEERVRSEWLDVRAEAEVQKRVEEEKHPELVKPGLANLVKLEVARWEDTLTRGAWRRTMVGVGLMFFQQFVGINALIYYSPSLFASLGLSPSNQLTMSGIMNILQLLGVTPSILLLDHLGRRPLLLHGSLIMTICHLLVAIIVGRSLNGWVGVAFIFLYMLSFGITWGPVPWAMPAELFSSSMRAKGVALAVVSNWFNNFIIGLVTPPLVGKSAWGAFTFFAAFSALSGVWTWFFVPETAGKKLEEMDVVWGDMRGREDRERMEVVLRRLMREEGEGKVEVKGV
ncbi:general substrate transporter [Ascodesmis nigricans]|uniref:General substrate transporter n=1 Tax=Ascodesmis nigricans TaxID=341454 RepID=A0A4S2MKP9_9PEZI|nr:general substrate transporter [Ascodesmis nigricans]